VYETGEELRGRVAVVTGAGRGIGRALAVGLAAHGAHVVAVSRTASEVAAVADEIRARGGQAESRRCDVASEAEVRALADWISGQFGQLHVLVNNAALRMIHVGDPTSYQTAVLDLTVEEWDRMLAVNLRGPFLMSKLLAPILQATGRGSIVNISAGAGKRGEAGRAPYAASKFGLEGLTQSLALEWQPLNIAVNTLSPGVSILTDALKLDLRATNPSLRYARPEVMVPPTIFLAQQDGQGVTGQHVDAWQWVQQQGLGGWDQWEA
jgi:NAD(P)-dependent dehydrogenase (short-subunit alcohol dehydrogenase family)